MRWSLRHRSTGDSWAPLCGQRSRLNVALLQLSGSRVVFPDHPAAVRIAANLDEWRDSTVCPLVEGAMRIRSATSNDLAAIENLLEASDLPREGVKENLSRFIVAEDGNELAGAIG